MEPMDSRKQPQRGGSYLMEGPDGTLTRVPADRLEAWKAADHSAPLTPAEQRLKEAILERLYGSRR